MIRTVELRELKPSTTNPRKSFPKEEMSELVASINANGVQVPLIVRPNGNGDLEYEIVDGERRYRAATAADLKEIDCDVRTMTNEQAVEFQLMTFLLRKDITPIEEAQAYLDLSAKGTSSDTIAAKLAKPVSHIVRMLRLLKLIPQAMQSFKLGNLPLAHALEICRLQPADQETAYVAAMVSYQSDKQPISVYRLKAFIVDNIHLDLRKISFDKTDATLVPKAGACINCVKRTGFNKELFPDITAADTCTEPACFKEKIEAHITNQKKKIKAAGTKPIEFTPDLRKPEGHKGAITCRSYKEIKGKECAHAVPGVAVDGPDRGKIKRICVDKECKQHWSKDTYGNTRNPKVEKPKTPQQIKKAAAVERERKINERVNKLLDEEIRRDMSQFVPSKIVDADLVAIADALTRDYEANDFAETVLKIKSLNSESVKKMKKDQLCKIIHLAVASILSLSYDDELQNLAKHWGMQVAIVRTRIRKEVEKELAPPSETNTPTGITNETIAKDPEPKAAGSEPKPRKSRLQTGKRALPEK